MNGSIKFSTWLWLLGAENGVEHIFKSSQKKKEDRVESEQKKKKKLGTRERVITAAREAYTVAAVKAKSRVSVDIVVVKVAESVSVEEDSSRRSSTGRNWAEGKAGTITSSRSRDDL
jgi:hypothetical protein